jgi:hypothetical protein
VGCAAARGRRAALALAPGRGRAPELAYNWNSQCAECHSTNLRKGYDAARDAFDTTWSDLDVACEACHGPGSRHVAWAEQTPRREAATAAARGLTV